MHYLVEALIVGIATAIVGFIISTLFMYIRDRSFRLENYKFWPYVLLSYFLTGVVIHIMFEMFGGNKWYCTNGFACRNMSKNRL